MFRDIILVCTMMAATATATAQSARIVGVREGSNSTGESPMFAVSANGLSVAGRANVAGQGVVPFRWREDTGLSSIPRPSSTWNVGGAYAISDDGDTIAGTFLAIPAGGVSYYGAFRWSPGTGYELLRAASAGRWSSMSAMSGDGSIVVGAIGTIGGDFRTAAYWTADPIAIEAMGTTIVDVAAEGDLFLARTRDRAVLFAPGGPGRPLEPMPGDVSTDAFGISRNGRFVLGTSNGLSEGLERATPFLWTADGGMENLIGLPGYSSSIITAINDDGSLGVGYARLSANSNLEPIVWTRDQGVLHAEDYFRSHGLDLTDWHGMYLTDLSADGTTIVGFGTHQFRSGSSRLEGFVVTIPAPASVGVVSISLLCICQLARRRERDLLME